MKDGSCLFVITIILALANSGVLANPTSRPKFEIFQKEANQSKECIEKCESTGDGFPFCNCGDHPNTPMKIAETPLKIAETPLKIAETPLKIAYTQDVNCTAFCKEVEGDGYPFCDCTNFNPPMRSLKLDKMDFKPVPINPKDKINCTEFCANVDSGDGFPFCKCQPHPPVAAAPIQN